MGHWRAHSTVASQLVVGVIDGVWWGVDLAEVVNGKGAGAQRDIARVPLDEREEDTGSLLAAPGRLKLAGVTSTPISCLWPFGTPQA